MSSVLLLQAFGMGDFQFPFEPAPGVGAFQTRRNHNRGVIQLVAPWRSPHAHYLTDTFSSSFHLLLPHLFQNDCASFFTEIEATRERLLHLLFFAPQYFSPSSPSLLGTGMLPLFHP